MAEPPARSSGGQGQRSRLQRRAPASIQISPVSDWKAAIPLLSPLITSPPSLDLTVEIKSCTNIKHQPTEPEKPIVLKAWQHPAVPFCYELPPPWVPFVCTGTLDRT